MSIEDKVAQAEKLIAEVKAELAEKASKARNWPEKIEAGMCFEREGFQYIFSFDEQLVNLSTGDTYASDDGFDGDEAQFTYLGHARDILTIRTDAHEPTGAELVGKRVNCFDMLGQHQFEGDCDEYNPNATYPYRVRSGWYFKARLAR